jgi:hypothetical protein
MAIIVTVTMFKGVGFPPMNTLTTPYIIVQFEPLQPFL